MKSTYGRRYRRRSSPSSELAALKKDNQHTQPFFNPLSAETFFKPKAMVQRECEKCEAKEKSVKQTSEEKPILKMQETSEEKPILKMQETSEEKPIQKMQETSEEKPIQKMEEKKEEKPIQKMEEKKEEKPILKMEEKKEEKPISKKEEHDTAVHNEATFQKEVSEQTSGYIDQLGGRGRSLPAETQRFFKNRMGADFSQVRVHTDSAATLSAKEMNAKAYAFEHNIVFNKGQYDPHSAQGCKLLAHELTHVAQQNGNGQQVSKTAEDQLVQRREEVAGSITTAGKSAPARNEVAYGGCQGVNVQGKTEANYTDSFTSSGTTAPSKKCTDCEPEECVSAKGTIISEFRANPVVSLPSVPDGLTECESKAVYRFINTTLKNHELQHVSAFKIYNGIIKTSYKFTGFKADIDSFIQSKHDDINTKRKDRANAKSDKLDPFNKPIPCNCKD